MNSAGRAGSIVAPRPRRAALARHGRYADRGLAEGVVGDRECHRVLVVAAGVVVAAHLRLVLEAARRCGAVHAHEELLRREFPGRDGAVDQVRSGLYRGFVSGGLVLERVVGRNLLRVAVLFEGRDEVVDHHQLALVQDPRDQGGGCDETDAGHELLHEMLQYSLRRTSGFEQLNGFARIGHDQSIMNSAGFSTILGDSKTVNDSTK